MLKREDGAAWPWPQCEHPVRNDQIKEQERHGIDQVTVALCKVERALMPYDECDADAVHETIHPRGQQHVRRIPVVEYALEHITEDGGYDNPDANQRNEPLSRQKINCDWKEHIKLLFDRQRPEGGDVWVLRNFE